MTLEQPKVNNGSHGLPKGEKPLVLDIGKYDYKKCEDISNTKLNSKVIELCKIPKKFNSNGGIALICSNGKNGPIWVVFGIKLQFQPHKSKIFIK